LTMEFVESHAERPWDWSKISSNSNITMDFVEAHPEKPWDWSGISKNPNLTLEYVDAHPEKPWNWNALAYNGFKLDPNFQYAKQRKERLLLTKFNKILRVTRTITSQKPLLIRFLMYHTIASASCGADSVQISKNLLYFAKK
jgi:hypothetical protein